MDVGVRSFLAKMAIVLALLAPGIGFSQVQLGSDATPGTLSNKVMSCTANSSGAAGTNVLTGLGSECAVFDLKSYGVLCDGVDQDILGFNATYAAALILYGAHNNFSVKVIGPGGIRCPVSGTVNTIGFTNGSNVVITDLQGASLGSSGSAAVIDAMGSVNMEWDNVGIAVLGGTPTTGLQFGRIGPTASNGGGSGFYFKNVTITGAFSLAALYNFSAEDIISEDGRFANTGTTGAIYGVVQDGCNHWQVSTLATQTAPADTCQSFNGNIFRGGSIKSFSPSGAPIWTENATGHDYDNVYLLTSGTNANCVDLFATAFSGSYGNNRALHLKVHCEVQSGGSIKSDLLVTGPGTGNPNFTATPLFRDLSYDNYYEFAATSIMSTDAGANITGTTLDNFMPTVTGGPTSPAFTMFDTPSNYTADGRAYFYAAGIWNGLASSQMDLNNAGVVSKKAAAGSFGTLVNGGSAPTRDAGNTPWIVSQTALPMILPPSGYLTAAGVYVIGQAPSNSATATFSATSGTGVDMTFSGATLLGTSADVGRVLTILDTTYKYATITAQNSTTEATVTITGTLSPDPATVASVAITGIAGQFSCTCTGLTVGDSLTLSGTYGGTGSITGYSNPTTYYVSATNGTSTFTLQTLALVPIVTTAGTPTGITYTVGGSATFANSAIWLSGTPTTNTSAFSVPLPATYASAYLYFPASSAIGSAGEFFCNGVSPTVLNCFNNTYTAGTPIPPGSTTAFSGLTPGPFTQTIGTQTLISVSIPGNSLGVNGELDFDALSSVNNNADTKTIALRYNNGYIPCSAAPSTSTIAAPSARMRNAGVANSQVASCSNAGTTTWVTIRGAIDSTSAQNALITGATATNATDFIVIEGYSMMVRPN